MNNVDFDFHSHTSPTSKCATQSLEESLKNAYESGIKYLAITDHNSVDAVKSAEKEAIQYGITIIRGAEISARVGNIDMHVPNWLIIHVLGLGLSLTDTNMKMLRDEEDRFSIVENKRYCDIAKYIKQKGYEKINLNNIKSASDLWNEMSRCGYSTNKREGKNIVKLLDTYTIYPKNTFNLKETVDIIHAMGGLAIWAHPCRGENHIVINNEEIDCILKYLVSVGLDGIEVYHYSNFEQDIIKYLLEKAHSYNLLISLGSDRHTAVKPYFSWLGTHNVNTANAVN